MKTIIIAALMLLSAAANAATAISALPQITTATSNDRMILDHYFSGAFATRQITVGDLLNSPNLVGPQGPPGSSAMFTNLTYSTNMVLNFTNSFYGDLNLSGNVNFIATNWTAASAISVRVYATNIDRNVFFPTNWIWIGASAPTNLTVGKFAILSATCFGSSNDKVVAAWGSQP